MTCSASAPSGVGVERRKRSIGELGEGPKSLSGEVGRLEDDDSSTSAVSIINGITVVADSALQGTKNIYMGRLKFANAFFVKNGYTK